MPKTKKTPKPAGKKTGTTSTKPASRGTFRDDLKARGIQADETRAAARTMRDLVGVPVKVLEQHAKPKHRHLVPVHGTRLDAETVCGKDVLSLWSKVDVDPADASVCKACRRINQPGTPAPKKGARTAARAADEAKAAKKHKKAQKARAAKKEAERAASPTREVPDEIAPKKKQKKGGEQRTLGESEDEPVGGPVLLPEATWTEQEIIQRKGTSGHFKVSIDGDDYAELVGAGTFLQRVAVVKGKMKALPTVTVIPEGAYEAEAEVLTREFEAKFNLERRPFDFEEAKRVKRPAPQPEPEPEPSRDAEPSFLKPEEREALEKQERALAEERTATRCGTCLGAKVVAREDKTPGGTVYLQEPCPSCEAEAHAEFRKNHPPPEQASEPDAPTTEPAPEAPTPETSA